MRKESIKEEQKRITWNKMELWYMEEVDKRVTQLEGIEEMTANRKKWRRKWKTNLHCRKA